MGWKQVTGMLTVDAPGIRQQSLGSLCSLRCWDLLPLQCPPPRLPNPLRGLLVMRSRSCGIWICLILPFAPTERDSERPWASLTGLGWCGERKGVMEIKKEGRAGRGGARL